MSNGISAAGFFFGNTALITASETQIGILTQQLNSNTKSTSLQGYGTSAPTILNLTDSVSQTQAFIKTSTQVNTTLSAYDTTLSQFSKDASQLSTALNQVSPTNPSTVATLQALINRLLNM